LQTFSGSARKARSDAYSIGSTSAQIPVGERKSGIPLSVETPAPVRTTHGWRVRISSARRFVDTAAMLRPMSEFHFANDVTVRFAETDAQGVAHHASYIVWFEVTRIEYLRRFRGGYLGLREEGVDALTLEAYAKYVDAARFDDRLTINARCGDLRGARFRFDYLVERDGQRIAEGWTTHACVTVGDHRPTRVPTWLAEAIVEAEAA